METTEPMIAVPSMNAYNFTTKGTEIEGGDPGVDVQFPWEDCPRRSHSHSMDISQFKISKTPITNDQYHQFLLNSGYIPKDQHRFLKQWDWPHSEAPPAEILNKPVVFVSRDDAAAYCRHVHGDGGRLPYMWEWQAAANGGDSSRKYPFGNDWRDDCHTDWYKGNGPLPKPADVDTFDETCCSPLGVCYMMANVWEWSSQFDDEHSRCSILVGGSFYQPQGSHWYFPTAYNLQLHSKYLMFNDGMDRAETLGFRCVNVPV